MSDVVSNDVGKAVAAWREAEGHWDEEVTEAAREVVPVLHAEVMRLTDRVADLTLDLHGEREKVAALQAIVEGRTAAPTDEEIDAHCSRYGAWVIGHRDGGGMMIAHDAGLAREIARRHRAHPGMGWTWHALDATGRPCAWPVVTPADGTAHEVVILCHGCGAPAGGTRPVPSENCRTPSCRACARGMTFEPFVGGARE